MLRKMTAALCGLLLLCLCFTAAAEDITVPALEIKSRDIPENEALQMVRDMKVGWNLGNTFDAIDCNWLTNKLDYESGWVGVKTSEALIDALKEAGFRTVRVPVSWHNHVDANYVIDADWLDRVQEVVTWIYDRGMYVIINIHHDEEQFLPSKAHYDESARYVESIWRQLAARFVDYDEHLIMESLNEPRLVGTSYEWNWNRNSKECKEAAEIINRFNKLFVDTIRASGGNNATRYLSVPAYAGSPWSAADEAFQLPNDTVENRIIVEAHAYTPYNFALNTGSTDHTFDLEKDGSKKNEIDQFLNKMYNRFISKGIPVMMDEFGALEKSKNTQDRVNFAAYYVAAASARGITCVWWDNHVFTGNGERFGLIKRLSMEWVYPDIVLAIMKNCMYNR